MATFFCLSLSCGEGEEGANEALTLNGSWAGPTAIVENGINLVDSDASLIFETDTFTYESSKDLFAKGSYKRVGSDHIEFMATESNTEIFPAGKSVLMKMTVNESSIEISNGKYQLILTKTSNGTKPIDEVISKDNGFISSKCQMTVGGPVWTFEFKDAQTFKLTIDYETNFASGNLKFETNEKTASLITTRTSIADLKNQKIYVEDLSIHKFKVLIYGQNDNLLLNKECFKTY